MYGSHMQDADAYRMHVAQQVVFWGNLHEALQLSWQCALPIDALQGTAAGSAAGATFATQPPAIIGLDIACALCKLSACMSGRFVVNGLVPLCVG